MTVQLGYLLPTRERIVAGDHSTGDILALAEHAESVGLDSIWVGDSLLAKPRHEPLALLSAFAARTSKITIGTAVLLPMLRNPVLLAHQLATIDQISEGRLIVGMGTARDNDPIRREFQAAGVTFEKRIGRMLEQIRLCRALWTGEAVNWSGLYEVDGGQLAPEPFTKNGPPLWGGGGVPAALKRAGRYFDGWMPSGSGTAEQWAEKWREIQHHATEAGRDPGQIVGSAYITVAIDPDRAIANRELDEYLESYYNQPAERIREQQYTFAGNLDEASAWIRGFVDAGASHLVVRFTGKHDREQMALLASIKDASH